MAEPKIVFDVESWPASTADFVELIDLWMDEVKAANNEVERAKKWLDEAKTQAFENIGSFEKLKDENEKIAIATHLYWLHPDVPRWVCNEVVGLASGSPKLRYMLPKAFLRHMCKDCNQEYEYELSSRTELKELAMEKFVCSNCREADLAPLRVGGNDSLPARSDLEDADEHIDTCVWALQYIRHRHLRLFTPDPDLKSYRTCLQRYSREYHVTPQRLMEAAGFLKLNYPLSDASWAVISNAREFTFAFPKIERIMGVSHSSEPPASKEPAEEF